MTTKSLCVSLTLAMMLISTLALAQAQTRCFPKSKADESPQQLVGIKTGVLPATENLSEMGATFYDFAVISSNQVQLHLYDKSKLLLATAELISDPSRNSLLYKIHPVDTEDAWVRVEHQLIEPWYLFSITSSNGHVMKVRVEIDSITESSKRSRSIKATYVQEKTRWVQVHLPDQRNAKDALSKMHYLKEILFGNDKRECFPPDS